MMAFSIAIILGAVFILMLGAVLMYNLILMVLDIVLKAKDGVDRGLGAVADRKKR